MGGGNFNMLDPAVAEKVRRGTHEYVPSAGRHGLYEARSYQHQEYPKMMLRTPRPQFKSFKKELLTSNSKNELEALLLGTKLDVDSLFQAACQEWEEEAQASIVKNKAEEEVWLAEHPEDQPAKITASTQERALGIKATKNAALAEHPVNAVRKA